MCPARDLLTQRLGALDRHPHRRQIIGRQELRQDLGIDLGSVLTFASAIARVFIGLEITTRATRGAIGRTIACVLHVASIATSSLGSRLSARLRSASGVVATCPAWRTRPSSHTAICARCRLSQVTRGL